MENKSFKWLFFIAYIFSSDLVLKNNGKNLLHFDGLYSDYQRVRAIYLSSLAKSSGGRPMMACSLVTKMGRSKSSGNSARILAT